ncbi:MAG: helix-turn-helix domain-containing protein [Thermoguttaceae bacterium]
METPSTDAIRLLTVKEVAARLSVSEALVYRMAAQRELEHVRVGIHEGTGKIRFRESEIDRYLSERKA